MVDVSLPAGTLSLLLDPITKFLFLDSYRVSHEEHLKRFSPGKRFEKLGKYFEFELHLESNYVSNATVPMSFVILRNTSGRTFKRVEVVVEADAGYVKYQDVSSLVEVGPTPVVLHLPRIPLKEIELTRDNRIMTSYNDVHVRLQIADGAVEEGESAAESLTIRPTYTEFLNSRWDKKWETVWNLDYIESRKTELRHRLYFYLVTRNRHRMAGEPGSWVWQSYKTLRLLIGGPLYRLLSFERVISTFFWIPIWFRVRKLEPRQDG